MCSLAKDSFIKYLRCTSEDTFRLLNGNLYILRLRSATVCPHAVPVLQGRRTPAVDFCSLCNVVVSVVILKFGGPTAVTLKVF